MKKGLLFLLFVLFGWHFMYSQVDIAAYSGESSPVATAVTNATATPLSRGTGVSSVSAASFNSSGWSQSSMASGPITSNDYIEWTISANIGYTVSIEGIEIDYDRSNSGPSKVFIRSSLDSYSTDIFLDNSVSASGEENTIDLSAAPLVSANGGSITFRLYGYDASAGSGTFDVEADLGTVLSLANTGIVLTGQINAAVSNDTDTEVYDTGSQPLSATVLSTTTTSGVAVDVFNMTIEDQGSGDGLSTKVTNIRLKPHTSNTADWTDHIQGVVVDDGASFLNPSNVNITDNAINISFTSTELNISDGGSEDVTVAIYLNNSGLVDGVVFSCFVDADDHGFTADASGSSFANSFLFGDFNSNDFTIDVEATELQFQVQPSDVAQNDLMVPAVQVAYTDANGNVDADYDGFGATATLSATGATLSGTTTTAGTPVAGVMVFNDISFTSNANGVTLTITDDGYITSTTVVSQAFDVTAPLPNVVINEFLADPDGDANGDGVVSSTLDEFIEFLNLEATSVDMSGWTIEDGFGLRHTFPASTIVPSGNSVVVFGGGTPTGIPGIVQVASGSNNLGLNNGGDDIYLYNSSSVLVTSYSYGSEGGDNQSLGRSPDGTGSFVKHSMIATNPVDFSPGRDNTDGSALPVNLVFFKATKKAQTTYLHWQTATEINNDYMAIERSSNGRDFEEITRVKGAGTTYEAQSYEYTDAAPLAGVNYYRLRQVDFDGKATLHNTVSVTFDKGEGVVRIIPTEAASEVMVYLPEQLRQTAQLRVYDLTGQLWMNQTLNRGTQERQLDVSALPQGHYFLQLIDGNAVETVRFNKI